MASLLARGHAIPALTRRANVLLVSRSGLASSTQSGSGKKSEKSSKKESEQKTSEPKLTKGVDPPAYVFKKADGPVGPGASKTSDYKNPEYFQYHDISFYDMEVVMEKFRLPQPSAKTLS